MDETRMPGTTGAGEVHTRIGVTPEPSKGVGTSGSFNPSQSTGGQGGGTVDQARQKAGEMADQARDKASEVADQARDKASEVASQARDKASSALNQAESRLEESGALRYVRENPMIAVGIAAGIGFLLAGSGGGGKRRGGRSRSGGKIKQQIKGAVMGGISAAISQELRNMLEGQGGLGAMLGMEQGGGSQGGESRRSRQGQGQQQGSRW